MGEPPREDEPARQPEGVAVVRGEGFRGQRRSVGRASRPASPGSKRFRGRPCAAEGCLIRAFDIVEWI